MAKMDFVDEKTLVSVDTVLPPKLSIIPIRTRPVFPGILMPMVIGGEKYIKTVENVLEKELKRHFSDNCTPNPLR